MSEESKLRFVQTNDENVVVVDEISDKGVPSSIGLIYYLDKDVKANNVLITKDRYVYFEFLAQNTGSLKLRERFNQYHDTSFDSLKDKILERYNTQTV